LPCPPLVDAACTNASDIVAVTALQTVTSSGAVVTADLFASGRYEVIAKVANASGLIWCVVCEAMRAIFIA
jgi:hypothetical protein